MLSDHFHLKGFESGVYGDPPSFLYWARQATVYVVALTTMKLLVLLILIWFPGLLPIGEWLLSWTHIGRGDSIQVILYAISLCLAHVPDHQFLVSWAYSRL
jgi:hypothetical protein